MAKIVEINGRTRVVSLCGGESRTEQHHANEVNINQIVSRYRKTGVLPPSTRIESYGDFSEVRDYHSACNHVREAQAAFMMLPSSIRSRFKNDVGALLAFLEDPENRAEAQRLGLVEAAIAAPDAASVDPAAEAADPGAEPPSET